MDNAYEYYKTMLIAADISKEDFDKIDLNLKKLNSSFTELIELGKKDLRPLNKNDKFISSHTGHRWGNKLKNSYDIFEDCTNAKYVRMHVDKNGENFYIFFDLDDLNKISYKNGNINNNKVSWFIINNGYVQGHWYEGKETDNAYMHHVIMSFQGTGKGFQEVSVDHIDRNPLNNRKSNLRLATMKEQQDNTKGILPGTKRNRKHNARPLPDGITELPKYVVYYRENMDSEKYPYRDFFRIEKHPKQISGQFKEKWATTKSMKVKIEDKLKEAVEKLKEMCK